MQRKIRGSSRTGAIAILLTTLVGTFAAPPHAQIGQPTRPELETDLLAGGEDAWTSPDWTRWQFHEGAVSGETLKFPEVATADPEAAAYLLTRQEFGGDLELSTTR